MVYDDFDSDGQKLGGKGYFLTKTTVALVSLLVVVLLVAEGENMLMEAILLLLIGTLRSQQKFFG